MTSQTRQQTLLTINISIPLSILLKVGPVCLFTWFVLQRAWLGDDIYITLRTVANFINGHGLVFNLGERVQSYTHPLWMFILSAGYAITHEAYFTTLTVSLATSIAAVILLQQRLAANRWSGSVAVFFLSLSSSFLDYSTSGLENPLTHLLLVIFAIVYFSQAKNRWYLFRLSLIAAMAFLNRQDVIIIYLPLLMFAFFTQPSWRGAWMILLGFLPAVAWEVFSVIYYGFPFPNTAYAKLNSTIPKFSLWRQGINYFIHTWVYDPYTLIMLILGAFLAVIYPISSRERVWMIGTLGYCAYVICIGGDFMGGRFLCLPFLAIAILLSQRSLRGFDLSSRAIFLFIMILLASFASSKPWSGKEFSKPSFGEHLIADERYFYFYDMGLMASDEWQELPRINWKNKGQNLARSEQEWVVTDISGIVCYYAGPEVSFIDGYALTDAFLARLVFTSTDGWRIGHFTRSAPYEYVRNKAGLNTPFADPELQQLYDRVTLVISGPIWSLERWQAIWELNCPEWLHEFAQTT